MPPPAAAAAAAAVTDSPDPEVSLSDFQHDVVALQEDNLVEAEPTLEELGLAHLLRAFKADGRRVVMTTVTGCTRSSRATRRS